MGECRIPWWPVGRFRLAGCFDWTSIDWLLPPEIAKLHFYFGKERDWRHLPRNSTHRRGLYLNE